MVVNGGKESMEVKSIFYQRDTRKRVDKIFALPDTILPASTGHVSAAV